MKKIKRNILLSSITFLIAIILFSMSSTSQAAEKVTTDNAVLLKNFSYLSGREIIPEDQSKLYIISCGSIYTYDYIQDTELQTLYKGQYSTHQTAYHIRNGIVYMALQKESTDTSVHIQGYDVINKKIVLEQDFPIETEKDRKRNFIVDDQQNVYFQTGDYTIVIYDKNGQYKDEYTLSRKINSLMRISKDNTVLVFDSGHCRVQDGKFMVYDYWGGMETGDIGNKMLLSPNQTYGVGQYGRIFEMGYTEEGDVCIHTIFRSLKGYGHSSNITACFEGNDTVYLEGSDFRILQYDITQRKVTNMFQLEPAQYMTIQYMTVQNGTLYILYFDNDGMHRYSIPTNQIPKVDTILVNQHIAYNHTKQEIIDQYNASATQFDYTQSVYQEQPVMTAPYYEGVLQDGVKQDTLKKVNFYRWLAGMTPVELSTTKMQRAQKGAVLMGVTKSFSHFQYYPKGTDMDYAFYQEGSTATQTSNLAYNTSMPGSILVYMNDNVGGAGHRLTLLSKTGTTISMGYYKPYSVLGMHEDEGTASNEEGFYAWPVPGKMLADGIETDKLWSITLGNAYTIDNDTQKPQVIVKVNGKTYSVPNATYMEVEDAVLFSLPDDLKKELTGGTYKFLPGIPIEVTVTGVTDEDFSQVTIQYTTEFFYTKTVPIDAIDISTASTPDASILTVVSEGEVIRLEDTNDTICLFINPQPANASDERYEIIIEDPSILSLENVSKTVTWYQTYRVTPLKSGKTNLIWKRVSDGAILRTQTIEVGNDLLKGDVNKDGYVRLYDAFKILEQAILGGNLTKEQLYIMDYNEDGQVTLFDAFKFLEQAILG